MWGIAIFRKNNDEDIETALAIRFNKTERNFLASRHIPPKKALNFDKHFTIYEIDYLIRMGLDPIIVNAFDSRFSIYEIESFLENKISSSEANSFDSRFKINDILYFAKRKKGGNYLSRYDKRFTIDDIYELDRNHVSPISASKARFDFSASDIVYFRKRKKSFNHLNKYPVNLSGQEIRELDLLGVTPIQASAFDSRFTSTDILTFRRRDVKANIANSYPEDLDAENIAFLYGLDIKPDTPHIDKIIPVLQDLSSEKMTDLLGMGANSIVIKGKTSAWKFSKEASYEYRLLEMIKETYKNRQHNVVKLRGQCLHDLAFSIEYIDGMSLDSLLAFTAFSDDKALINCGTDIIKGLTEMREAGIVYHRDIRPANIMFDTVNDRIVIIDLGIATTDPEAVPVHNRRYGGPNDLNSVGQIIYKIAVGRHIFAESRSMEMTVNASRIRDAREEIYDDPTGKKLEAYLERVDSDIPEVKIKQMCIDCLTAGKDDHERLLGKYG